MVVDPALDDILRPWQPLDEAVTGVVASLHRDLRTELVACARGDAPAIVLGAADQAGTGALAYLLLSASRPSPAMSGFAVALAFGLRAPGEAFLGLLVTSRPAGVAEWTTFVRSLPATRPAPANVLADAHEAVATAVSTSLPTSLLLLVPGGFWG